MDFTRAVVRVRLDGFDLDVHGEHERIRRRVLRHAWRDIDALASQSKHQRCPLRRIVCEVQAYQRLHELAPPVRLHVHFHDEIALAFEPPGQALWKKRRDLSRRPSEKVAVGIRRRMRDQAVVARVGIGIVHPTRRARTVYANVRVMDDTRIPRPEFQTPHIAPAIDRQRNHEDPEHIGPGRRQRERRRRRDHEIRFPQLPARLDARRRRQIARVALDGAGINPSLEDVDFLVGQPRLPYEPARHRRRLPRRHVTRPGRRGDQRGFGFDVTVGQDAERSGAARMVTLRAAIEENRGNVFRIGGRLRTGLASRKHAHQNYEASEEP